MYISCLFPVAIDESIVLEKQSYTEFLLFYCSVLTWGFAPTSITSATGLKVLYLAFATASVILSVYHARSPCKNGLKPCFGWRLLRNQETFYSRYPYDKCEWGYLAFCGVCLFQLVHILQMPPHSMQPSLITLATCLHTPVSSRHCCFYINKAWKCKLNIVSLCSSS